MWIELSGPISHVPRPPTTTMISVASATRLAPLKAIAAPSTRNGSVLPIRWSKPPCRNGEATTPSSPSISRGSMPCESQFVLNTWSRISTTHMIATIPATNRMPVSREVRLGLGSISVAVVTT